METYYSESRGGASRKISPHTGVTFTAKKPRNANKRSFERSSHREWRTPSDNENFSAIKRSGVVKFTPHSAGNISIVNSIAEVRSKVLNPSDEGPYQGVFCATDSWGYDTPDEHQPAVWQEEPMIQRGDLTYWLQQGIPFYGLHEDDISRDISNKQASVVASLATDYDMLTDAGEALSTFHTVASIYKRLRNPVNAFMSVADRVSLMKKKGAKVKHIHDVMTNAWMEYRYGVMPLVHSMNDLRSYAEGLSNKYKTERGSVSTSSRPAVRDMSKMHIYESGVVTTDVRITGKVHYSNPGNRAFDQLGFNPFSTAWELIPLSFVVDWFINVGDTIASSTVSSNFSKNANFCISTKVTGSVETHLYVPPNEKTLFKKECVSGCHRVLIQDTPVGGGLLQSRRIDTYERDLFLPGDLSLTWNPNITGPRLMDTWALMSKPLIQRLRRR